MKWRWLDGSHHTVRRQYYPNRGEYVAWVKAEAVPQEPFSLLIGDCLQNLRSSLDHLAYELASSHAVPFATTLPKARNSRSSKTRTCSKPRTRLASQGGEAGSTKSGESTPAAQAIIEDLQPVQARGRIRHRSPLEAPRTRAHRQAPPPARSDLPFRGRCLESQTELQRSNRRRCHPLVRWAGGTGHRDKGRQLPRPAASPEQAGARGDRPCP